MQIQSKPFTPLPSRLAPRVTQAGLSPAGSALRFSANKPAAPKVSPIQRVQSFLTSFPTVTWLLSHYGPKNIPAPIQAGHEKLLDTLPLDIRDDAREEYRTQLIRDYRAQRVVGKSDAQIIAEYERLTALALASEQQLAKLEALGFSQTLKTIYEQDQREITDCVNTLLLANLPESLRRIDDLGEMKGVNKPEITPVILTEALDILSNTLLCDSSLHDAPALMTPDGRILQGEAELYSPEELRDELTTSLNLQPETADNLLKWTVQAARHQPNLLAGFTTQAVADQGVILTTKPETDHQRMSLRTRWSQGIAE